ncbi:MAG: coproporphyrinogen III oxidase, partial [Hyphomicrobiales bacterium]|nr:coproporphyrinogen III oxidase [Hyphomicrobiales bacterium]
MHDSGARNNAENDFGIYIHWPFCVSKCPYCDFNSHVARDGIDSDLWTKMLRTELDSLNKRTRFPKNPVSVFFGGGTPSLMASGSVAALLETIDTHWGINAETEISLEANPESVSKEKLQAYRA